MKRSRFSEEQIIGILKEHQAGLSAKELCRKHGVSDATFYKWRSKFGGMEVPAVKKLKLLEAENAKLKKLLAAQTGWSQGRPDNNTSSQLIV
ncbi:putative transposase [Primorskyibacter sedentarius]|uniref:Putative transposase n=1 Tax=Primorskyibacter sedentarius TaxID=745311 RepID=A0A4R3II21_9RHOB|nr:putative transposase [Primorskyibacter sedentarius]